MSKLQVLRETIRLEVIEENNQWTVKTPLYTLNNVPIGDIQTVVAPFSGMNAKFDVIAPTPEIAQQIQQTFTINSTQVYFRNPFHKAPINYLDNLANPEEFADCGLLRGAIDNKPAIFIGGGPSVKNHIEELKRIKQDNSAFIIAGGSGIRVCHEYGIKPHLAVAFDAMEHEYNIVFKHIDPEWTKDIPLLGFAYLDVKCYEMWQGKRYLVAGMSAFATADAIDGLTFIRDGGSSVSTFAIHLAKFMKAESLHLVGVDLALEGSKPEELSYYADNSDEAEQRSQEIAKVVYYEEANVFTRREWIREAYLMAQDIKELKLKVYRTEDDNLLLIEGVNKRRLKHYKKSYHLDLRYEPYKDREFIRRNLERLYHEAQAFLVKGIKDPTIRSSLLYEVFLAPYDFHASYREIWTRHYDESVAYLLVIRMIKALQQ